MAIGRLKTEVFTSGSYSIMAVIEACLFSLVFRKLYTIDPILMILVVMRNACKPVLQ